jgi:phosphate-selective porin OprO/OprP
MTLLALTIGTQASFAEDSYTAALDELWSFATLYKDDRNPILEEFKLRGRYQGQYWDVDADQGSQSNWEDRRSRFGFDAKLFEKKIEVRADFQSNDGFDDIYDGLVDAYIRWKPTSSLSFTLGKTKPLIGQYDWLESSNSEPTFERSQIFNQLNINRATAFTVEHSIDEFSWRAGIYSNDTPSNTGGSGAFGDGEFGDMNGGFSTTLGVGYDFKGLLCTDKADFRFDWLHSDREAGDFVLGRYDDILSATFVVRQEAAAVVLESYFASGGDGDDSDVFGFFIQPTYNVIPKKLQLVGRYSFANSSGPLGVIGQSRYEKPVADNGARGDIYNAFYGGVQYFIYGDKLKLMAGAEWAQLRGNGEAYEGTTLLTGIRLSF